MSEKEWGSKREKSERLRRERERFSGGIEEGIGHSSTWKTREDDLLVKKKVDLGLMFT